MSERDRKSQPGSSAEHDTIGDTVSHRSPRTPNPRTGDRGDRGDRAERIERKPFQPLDKLELPTVGHEMYRIEGEVSRGGIGRIVRARDVRLNRVIALKELLRPSAELRARFLREVHITARLQHPAIVPVYEAGVWSDTGEAFFAMKLVSGRPLSSLMREAKTPVERLALLPHVLNVAEAVAYAHSHRVIHRDLKPANVLVGEFGETVVIDWGLAKDLTEGEVELAPSFRGEAPEVLSDTMFGTVLGTPPYMPPEQARGEVVDERADVYALGAILYHVLAGVPPYPAVPDFDALLNMIINSAPVELTKHYPSVPPDLAAIVGKAMARDPAQRYATARELAAELRRFQTGQLVGAYAYRRRDLVVRWMRRNRAPLAVAAVLLTALVATGVVSVRGILRETRVAQANAETSRRRLLRLYEEEGRIALLGGDFMRGLLFLGEAYIGGEQSESLRFLLNRAMRSVDAQRLSLQPHEGRVVEAEFSPDGRTISTTGEDKKLRIWDAQSGKLLWSVQDHNDLVQRAAFSPDGSKILTCSLDGTARIVEAQSGHTVVDLEGHASRPWWCDFSPNQQLVVSPDPTDSVARIWDAQSGKLLQQLPHGHIFVARFAPDNRRVVTCGEEPAVKIWDARAGTRIVELKGHTEVVRDCAFSPDGTTVVTASGDGTARLWNAQTGAKLRTFTGHTAGLWQATFTKDGTRVATTAEDHTTKLWDVGSGRLLQSFIGGGQAWLHRAARFSPDDQRIATVDENTVRLWDADTGKLIGFLSGHTDTISTVAFNRDGTRLVSASFDKTAKVWDVGVDEIRASVADNQPAVAAVFSRDGKQIAIARPSRAVTVVDAATGRVLHKVATQDAIALDFSADGKTLVAATATAAELWDLGREELKLAIGGAGPLWSAKLSPDGHLLATAHDNGAVQIWNADSGARIRTVHHEGGAAFSATFSPDGRRLLTAGSDKTAKIWETGSGALVLTLTGHAAAVHSAVYSRDGARVLTSSADKTARVWDAASGQLLTAVSGHGLELSSAEFSPEAGRLVTSSFDGTVRVWDGIDGRLLAVLDRHTKPVNAAAFSPDGEFILSASDDGFVHVWNARIDLTSPKDVEAFERCRIPMKLVDGKLLPATPDPKACAK